MSTTDILAHLFAALGALCGLTRLSHFCGFRILVALSIHWHDGEASDSHTLAIAPVLNPLLNPCLRLVFAIHPKQLQFLWGVIIEPQNN